MVTESDESDENRQDFIDVNLGVVKPKRKRATPKAAPEATVPDADAAIAEAPNGDVGETPKEKEEKEDNEDEVDSYVVDSQRPLDSAASAEDYDEDEDNDEEDTNIVRAGVDSISPDGKLTKGTYRNPKKRKNEETRVDMDESSFPDFDEVGPSPHDVVRDFRGAALQETISSGNSGGHVFAIQGALWRAGSYRPVMPSVIDGIYAGETEAAVKLFQDEHGLTVTGSVDKETWAELRAYSTGDRNRK